MIMKLLAVAGLTLATVAAQAQLPEASAAAAPVGSFLQIAADAGQKIATLANGEAAAQKDQDQANTANTATDVPAVPEPETYALMLAGLAAMGLIVRRRKG